MEKQNYDINEVMLVGRLEDWFQYDHRVKDVLFFMTYMLVQRASGIIDRIPLIVREDMIENLDKSILNHKVHVYGHIVTNMIYNELLIKVRVNAITPVDDSVEDKNEVVIAGCFNEKYPYLRTTFTGKEICDFLVISRRKYQKSAIIPVIAWNRVARYIIENFYRGNVYLKARFQSREIRDISNGIIKSKTVYELSAYYATCYFKKEKLEEHDNDSAEM